MLFSCNLLCPALMFNGGSKLQSVWPLDINLVTRGRVLFVARGCIICQICRLKCSVWNLDCLSFLCFLSYSVCSWTPFEYNCIVSLNFQGFLFRGFGVSENRCCSAKRML
ncbi:hypothetical protein L1049_004601 [Liquidambar formosana]|uniref:Uncharacterized protein n=1 Tax=Liquidambar formosana TaxID=63359 RepID=A0AAP0RNE9_LIQFO